VLSVSKSPARWSESLAKTFLALPQACRINGKH
jgi:hypothetical protein